MDLDVTEVTAGAPPAVSVTVVVDASTEIGMATSLVDGTVELHFGPPEQRTVVRLVDGLQTAARLRTALGDALVQVSMRQHPAGSALVRPLQAVRHDG